jgi:hypothetical protein
MTHRKRIGAMAKLTSDFFVDRLKEWGVTRIYG